MIEKIDPIHFQQHLSSASSNLYEIGTSTSIYLTKASTTPIASQWYNQLIGK
jgi:hypothetical protein